MKKTEMRGFVLLEQPEWDADAFCRGLQERWDLKQQEQTQTGRDSLSLTLPDGKLEACLIPAPVPDEKAVDAARYNFWDEGVMEVARTHRAHLALTATGTDALQTAKLFVKAAETAVSRPGVLGILANGTVYDPEAYTVGAEPLHRDELPLSDLVWIGMATENDGDTRGFTMGMEAFGVPEMEIVYAQCHPFQLLGLLAGIAEYLIETGAVLKSGEPFALPGGEQICAVLSQGVEFPDRQTLKIPSP